MFDIEAHLAIPRVSGLVLSPDGRRLVTTVATVAPDGKKFVSALWSIDPDGADEPRRLTHSAPGEGGPVFLPSGALLFTSKRVDPSVKPDEKADERARLWVLPPDGEARCVLDVPSGIEAVATARDAGLIAFASGAYPGTSSTEEDAERHQARKDKGVTAQMFESYPIRSWDHYLGPRERRLFVTDPPPSAHDGRVGEPREIAAGDTRALDEVSFDVTPDGRAVVTGFRRLDDITKPCVDLVAIDVATGDRRVLLQDDATHGGVTCSPDGRWAACVRSDLGSPESAGDRRVVLVNVTSGESRTLGDHVDLWPSELAWGPDSKTVYFTADQDGRAPLFRIDVDSGEVTRLSRDGAFTDPCVSPDGRTVYALRSSFAGPPEVVALDTSSTDQEPRRLPTPGQPVDLPGRVEELVATASDGTPIHCWLVLPSGGNGSGPFPLAVFIHGGPVMSWNGWTWRWNPHILAARGYAVLLPDPALSTGYGKVFVDRGWGKWGEEPFTDIMSAVDAACARDDVDETRTAALGASFGGYMANWVAGHTDRFNCIVTHASLWALDQFHGTTDVGSWWERQFGDPYEDLSRYEANSPHRSIGSVKTPMLVVHGELDHRVPISEGLRLWTDLRRHSVESKFLYFPDENHWILKPQNAKVWYDTVLSFLDQHVLGKDWVRPELL